MKIKERIYRAVESMETDGRTIRGVAVVTNSWSKDLGGFRELIKPEALTDDLIKKSDIMLNVDHDPSKILARSRYGKGSLRVFKTDRGLEFETTAPNTTLGNDMIEMLKRGDYSQCSFCFTLPKDESCQRWYNNANGELCREISQFDRLYDVSVVYDPAYDATYVDARSAQMVELNKKLNDLEKLIHDIFPYD